MIPYFAMNHVTHALFVSIGITVVILNIFGFVKNYVTIGTKRAGFYGAAQTLFIGVLAAATSYGTDQLPTLASADRTCRSQMRDI